jgi:hypothetical protein
MASAPPTLVTPKFVFAYPLSPNVNDYRCVVNAAGTLVIVERTVSNSGGGKPQLYLVDLASGATTSLLPSLEVTTRPDWCWQTGVLAFNYSEVQRVGVLAAMGDTPELFPNTTTMDYPTWFPDGDTLATESGQGSPAPNTTTLDPKTGTIIAQTLEGTNLYGGMPSANPAKPNLIAFAGQAIGSPYNQDMNYIWVKDTSSSEPAVPLEYNALATADFCPAFQGRAPWWSPDGKMGGLRIEPRLRAEPYAPEGHVRHLSLRIRRAESGFRDHRLGLQLQSRQVVSERVLGRARAVPAYRRRLAEWRNDEGFGALRPCDPRSYAARHHVLRPASRPAVGEQPHDHEDDHGRQHIMLGLPVMHGEEGLGCLGRALRGHVYA